jgi:hypothetical protein
MSSTPPIISTTISLDHDGTYVFSEVASAEVKIVNREIVMLTHASLTSFFCFAFDRWSSASSKLAKG